MAARLRQNRPGCRPQPQLPLGQMAVSHCRTGRACLVSRPRDSQAEPRNLSMPAGRRAIAFGGLAYLFSFFGLVTAFRKTRKFCINTVMQRRSLPLDRSDLRRRW